VGQSTTGELNLVIILPHPQRRLWLLVTVGFGWVHHCPGAVDTATAPCVG